MISYAGIGSRQITDKEKGVIFDISSKLSKKYVLYSGSCNGSDINFQKGSNKNCVLFLPWKTFNVNIYSLNDCLDWYDMGKSSFGLKSIEKYHPNPKALSFGGKCMMARNYHQIMGYDKYPKVSFVVCCANRDKTGKILGGTGFACSIALDLNIPIINIRDPFYDIILEELLLKF